MANTGSAKTSAASVYQRIRAGILGGRLRVGQRRQRASMASDYGASLNILREASSQLAGGKLVKMQSQRGFAVTAMTAEELRDLTFVRVSVEGIALARSLELGDVEWEAGLLAAHHRLANTPVLDPAACDRLTEADVEAHSAFHAALIGACDSPMLMEIRPSLHDASELYRPLAYLTQRGRKDEAQEHRLWREAALARDADKSTMLLAKHYGDTTRVCTEAQLVVSAAMRGA